MSHTIRYEFLQAYCMEIERELIDDITIYSMFCRKFTFNKSRPADEEWVIQAHSVLAMITSGKGRVEIVSDSAILTVDKPMRPFLLPAYTRRRPVPQGDGFEVLASDFQVEMLHGLNFCDMYELPFFFPADDESRLQSLMLRLLELDTDRERLAIVTAFEYKSIYYDIVKTVIRNSSLKADRGLFDPEKYACFAAIEYLSENFRKPLDMKKLQRMCNLSQAHFFRLFKRNTGQTPFNYLKRCRLKEAQKLLLRTDMTVCEIGEEVGWMDAFHFSRIFKKEIGLSPLHYRKQMAF